MSDVVTMPHAAMSDMAAYAAAHQSTVEHRLGHAVDTVFREAVAEDPCTAIGWQLTDAEPLVLPPKDTEEGQGGKWSLPSWLQNVGVHRAVAAAIKRPLGDEASSDSALALLKSLRDRNALAAILKKSALLESIVDLVWSEVETLQSSGAASSDEIQSKFAGSIALSYSGLDTFFGGLEGVAGSPSPKLLEAMTADHTQGPGSESTDPFVTGNYGVRTTSQAEWVYVVDAEATPESLKLERWPEESEQKMPDRSRCRRRRELCKLEEEAEPRNAQLVSANQPPLIREELIAACLYTGPMFVKYNGVLRGLQSPSPFLRGAMIELCCPADTFAAYKEGSKSAVGEQASFDTALRQLNRYTTTLHGINSAIIKLGKLTAATKVYRGIAGMSLPDEFWIPNEFGVRGGVEGAFMSTTLEQAVAMGYAAGDGLRMGIVVEVQQGMVNRGADISWLSQYPHEREILFGPLTGIEVQRTRIDGSVVVIECAFSVNLTALTLEQVLAKRMKIVRDAADGAALEASAALLNSGGAPKLAEAAANTVRMAAEHGLFSRGAEWFNEDENLSFAVDAVTKVKAAVLACLLPRGDKAGGQEAALKTLSGGEARALLCEHAPAALGALPAWLTSLPVMQTHVQDLALAQLSAIPNADDLSRCAALQTLTLADLDACPTVEGLCACSLLTTLTLERLPLNSVVALSGCTSLRTLALRSLPLASVDDLAGCVSLEELTLSGLQALTSLEGLAGLPALRTLNLRALPLSSVASLASCTQLQALRLAELPNFDAADSVLRCTGLTSLTCHSLDGISSLKGFSRGALSGGYFIDLIKRRWDEGHLSMISDALVGVSPGSMFEEAFAGKRIFWKGEQWRTYERRCEALAGLQRAWPDMPEPRGMADFVERTGVEAFEQMFAALESALVEAEEAGLGQLRCKDARYRTGVDLNYGQRVLNKYINGLLAAGGISVRATAAEEARKFMPGLINDATEDFEAMGMLDEMYELKHPPADASGVTPLPDSTRIALYEDAILGKLAHFKVNRKICDADGKVVDKIRGIFMMYEKFEMLHEYHGCSKDFSTALDVPSSELDDLLKQSTPSFNREGLLAARIREEGQIHTLTLSGLDHWTSLDGIHDFEHLHTLMIDGLHGLASLDGILRCTSLRSLTLRNLDSLTSLDGLSTKRMILGQRVDHIKDMVRLNELAGISMEDLDDGLSGKRIFWMARNHEELNAAHSELLQAFADELDAAGNEIRKDVTAIKAVLARAEAVGLTRLHKRAPTMRANVDTTYGQRVRAKVGQATDEAEDPQLERDIAEFDVSIRAAKKDNDANLEKMLEMAALQLLPSFRLPPELWPEKRDGPADVLRALELTFVAKAPLRDLRDEADMARHGLTTEDLLGDDVTVTKLNAEFDKKRATGGEQAMKLREGSKGAQLRHLTLSSLPRLARLDALAECTSLESLTLGAGLEYVSLLPDLSTRSDLEVRTADGTSPLVKAWAAAKSVKKLKQAVQQGSGEKPC